MALFHFSRNKILVAAVVTVTFILSMLAFLPPEESLGNIIKVVYIHASLVQTGLLVFLFSGAVALALLFSKRESWSRSLTALQKTGLATWSLYLLSSSIVTQLAWGVWIAWEEPRVTASIAIWITCVLFYALTMWIKNTTFSAAANALFAGIAIWLAKTSGTIRHPHDPIGGSNSVLYKIFFAIILLSTLIFAFIMFLFFLNERESKTL